MDSQVYIQISKHPIYTVQSMVCQFYFNRAVFKKQQEKYFENKNNMEMSGCNETDKNYKAGNVNC